MLILALSILVALAVHAELGWRGLVTGTAVYTIAVAIMAVLAVMVILAVQATWG